MAQKTISAGIVLFGRVDNSVGQIGNALVNLGAYVDQVSQKLIDFGKESVKVYRNYEDSMLDAEGALSTIYGMGSRQLKGVMKDLNVAASNWAASTIFHTNDVANAISEAAHAGWDYEQILSGIPSAIRLAQAGGMDLSQAMDYIITSTNAANISFEDLSHWVDVWAFAANSSAGTVTEFGEAFERMGRTMAFASSPEELVTMLAALHDTGTKGAAAGTLLRNSMIRLIAPTQKASDVMMGLGVTEADISEALSEANGNFDAATESLKNAGFSAYDAQGNLKGFVEIFGDLNKALDGMTEEEKNNVLSAIFPTRTLTGALALLDAVEKGFNGLYDKLVAGGAEGYGEDLSELMMSGVTGDIEILLSKWENLEKRVGETLAPTVEKITGLLGKIVDAFANMDDGAFNGIVSGLETIAVAGPGLMIAGGALKFIGKLLSPTGLIAAGAVSVLSLAMALHGLNEVRFEENFGTGELDTTALNEYVNKLSEDFHSAYEKVDQFRAALDTAVTSYENASSAFASDIFSAVLTKKEFTQQEIDALVKQGEQIYGYVVSGLTAANDASAEYFNALLGGEGVAEGNPAYQEIIDNLSRSQTETVEKAGEIQENIHNKLMEGFRNGFTEADYDEILTYFSQYNELIAQAERDAAQKDAAIEREMTLHKMQTASYEELEAYTKELRDKREAEFAILQDAYERERANQAYIGASDDTLKDIDDAFENQKAEFYAGTDEMIKEGWMMALSQSDIGDAYNTIEGLAGLYASGALSGNTIDQLLLDKFGGSVRWNPSDRDFVGKYLGNLIDMLGGRDALAERIETYKGMDGMGEFVDDMQQILLVDQLVNQGSSKEIAPASDYSVETARAAMDAAGEGVKAYFDTILSGKGASENLRAWEAMTSGEQSALMDIVSRLNDVYDFSKVNAGDDSKYAQKGAPEYDYYATQKLMNMSSAEAERFKFTPQITLDQQDMAALELEPLTMDVAIPNALQTAQDTHMLMASQFTPITQTVNIVQSGSMRLPAMTLPKKAKGGRETVPSIIAEAGIPEWYIPEEHTKNTAELLLGAAYGSGFDILELAEYAGARLFADGGNSTGASVRPLDWSGLSSDGGGSDSTGGGSSIQVQYSPIVHSDNAESVRRVLADDKKRFEAWFNEWWQKKQLYESMVNYK